MKTLLLRLTIGTCSGGFGVPIVGRRSMVDATPRGSSNPFQTPWDERASLKTCMELQGSCRRPCSEETGRGCVVRSGCANLLRGDATHLLSLTDLGTGVKPFPSGRVVIHPVNRRAVCRVAALPSNFVTDYSGESGAVLWCRRRSPTVTELLGCHESVAAPFSWRGHVAVRVGCLRNGLTIVPRIAVGGQGKHTALRNRRACRQCRTTTNAATCPLLQAGLALDTDMRAPSLSCQWVQLTVPRGRAASPRLPVKHRGG